MFIDNLAREAEQAAARGDSSTVYKITKKLCGKRKQTPPVKDTNGQNITTEKEQAARWVEHFRSVLNRPNPIDPLEDCPDTVALDIDIDPPTKEEILKAVTSLKSGKSPGLDGICAELLKADPAFTTDIMKMLFDAI